MKQRRNARYAMLAALEAGCLAGCEPVVLGWPPEEGQGASGESTRAMGGTSGPGGTSGRSEAGGSLQGGSAGHSGSATNRGGIAGVGGETDAVGGSAGAIATGGRTESGGAAGTAGRLPGLGGFVGDAGAGGSTGATGGTASSGGSGSPTGGAGSGGSSGFGGASGGSGGGAGSGGVPGSGGVAGSVDTTGGWAGHAGSGGSGGSGGGWPLPRCGPDLVEGERCLLDDFDGPISPLVTWSPTAFRPTESRVVFEWVADAGRNGTKALSIYVPGPERDDARWERPMSLTFGAWYELSGFIKTAGVVPERAGADGANFSKMDSFDTSTDNDNGIGTLDWHGVSFVFEPNAGGSVSLAARLGLYGAMATGKAWFDDVYLERFRQSASTHVSLFAHSEDLLAVPGDRLVAWLDHLEKVYLALEQLLGVAPSGQSFRIVPTRKTGSDGWETWTGDPIRWPKDAVRNQFARITADDDWCYQMLSRLAAELHNQRPWKAESHNVLLEVSLYYAITTRGGRVALAPPGGPSTLYQGEALEDYFAACATSAEIGWNHIVYRLIQISKTIGWDSFAQTFAYFNALASNDVPASDRGRFDLFLDQLAVASGVDVRGQFTADELAYVAEQLPE